MNTPEPQPELMAWPKSAEEATADRMVIHALRQASVSRGLSSPWMRAEYRTDDPELKKLYASRYMDHLTRFIDQSQVAAAIAIVQRDSGTANANALARELWHLTEDGGALDEFGWQWMQERGVDAQAHWDWMRAAGEEEVARLIEEEAKK